jgi:DNA-binding protein H-NS
MNYEEMPSDQLRAVRDAINAVLDSRVAAERASAEADILEAAKAHGIDLKKLAGGIATVKSGKKSGGTVAVKYRNGELTWTGRGKTPKWAAEAKEAGTLESFRVIAEVAN